MRLGDIRGPVVGADVTVHVEDTHGLVMGGRVAFGETAQQAVGLVFAGQAADPTADRLELRGPVETEEAAHIDRIDAGQALGAGFAQHRGEHDGQQPRT